MHIKSVGDDKMESLIPISTLYMTRRMIEEAPFLKFLFMDTRIAWLWLIARVYVGWQWLEAGWGKFENPAWWGGEAGGALNGFIQGALAKTSGAHPDVQGWYAWFLENAVSPNASVWSHVVVAGEVLVGVGLILGAFTGIAAFFGFFMNLNFLLAGTVSTNPILFTLSLLILLGWRIAGYYGVDYWLLPRIGVPWKSGGMSFDQNK